MTTIHPAAINAATRIARTLNVPVLNDFAPYAVVIDRALHITYLISNVRGVERVYQGRGAGERDALAISNATLGLSGLNPARASWGRE